MRRSWKWGVTMRYRARFAVVVASLACISHRRMRFGERREFACTAGKLNRGADVARSILESFQNLLKSAIHIALLKWYYHRQIPPAMRFLSCALMRSNQIAFAGLLVLALSAMPVMARELALKRVMLSSG